MKHRLIAAASLMIVMIAIAAVWQLIDPRMRAELPILSWTRPHSTPVPTPIGAHEVGAARSNISIRSWFPDEVYDVDASGGRLWIAWAGGLQYSADRPKLTGVYSTFNASHGLPNNTVRSVVALDDGAWVASGASVVRIHYTGYPDVPRIASSIEPAVAADLAPKGIDGLLAPSLVVDLVLDADRESVLVATHGEGAFRVWECDAGLCTEPLELGSSKVAHSVSTLRRLTSIATGTVGDEQIIAAGTTGAGVLMLRNGHFTQTAQRGGLAAPIVPTVAISGGQLWAGTVGGLNRFDGRAWHDVKPDNTLAHPGVAATNGQVFAVVGRKLRRFDGKSWTTVGDVRATTVRAATHRAGDYLIATDGGLYRLHRDRLTQWRVGRLSSGDISALAKDDLGVWIGSFDRGVMRYSDGAGIDRMKIDDMDPHVNALQVIDGELWVATIQGLYRVGLFGSGLPASSDWIRWTDSELPSAHVNAIASDGDSVWIGTSKGLARADLAADGWSVTNAWRNFHGLPFHIVYSLAPTSDGVWVGGLGGAAFFDGRTFTRYSYEAGQLPDPWINSVHVTDRHVWFGTYDAGVASFDGETWSHHLTEDGWVFPNASLALPDGSVWFGTMGGGVAILDRDGWRRVLQSDGLAGDDVTALLYDAERHVVWVGTRTGLSQISFEPAGES